MATSRWECVAVKFRFLVAVCHLLLLLASLSSSCRLALGPDLAALDHGEAFLGRELQGIFVVVGNVLDFAAFGGQRPWDGRRSGVGTR